MSVHVFVFLLVVCLLLSLALLYCLDSFPLRPFASKGAAKGPTVQRLLKPRSPADCPACHSSSTISAGVGPAPADVASLERGQKMEGVRAALLPMAAGFRLKATDVRSGWQCHVTGRVVNMPAEELEWSLASGREDLSAL